MYSSDEYAHLTPPPVPGARGAEKGIAPLAWSIGECLAQGVLLEVATLSKPGLVCPGTCGAHQDMSLMTFMAGSAAIIPAFFQCASEGLSHIGPPAALLPRLRAVGRPAEERLLEATRGVNTQRGALFAAGLVAGAAGLAARDLPEKASLRLSPRKVCLLLKEMTKGLVERELAALGAKKKMTAGERLFQKYGVQGIRGEMERGLPSVFEAGLPALEEGFRRGADLNGAFLHTLFVLMTQVEDTTILWRADMDALEEMRRGARGALAAGSVFTGDGQERIRAIERDFVKKKLSPGGCADMLAVTIAMYLMEHGSFPVAVM